MRDNQLQSTMIHPGQSLAIKEVTMALHAFNLNLSAPFKLGGQTILHAPLSIQLTPGERVGLIGPNGSGKTTLLSIVAIHQLPEQQGTIQLTNKL